MENTSEQKAVILITIDALRADHLQSYGYHRNTAPNLERLIEKGTTFLNAISNGPETPSSFSSIFSSKLPFSDGGYSPLPLNKVIFPQILKSKNIFTFGIHSNPHLGEYFNYNRGFDVFLDGERYKAEFHKPKRNSFKTILSLNLRKILNYRNFSRKVTYRLRGFNKISLRLRNKYPFFTQIFLPFLSIAYDARFVIQKIITLLNKHSGPLFIWSHFMDVHSPFNPPSKNVLKFRKSDIDYSRREYLNECIRATPEKYNVTKELINELIDLYDAGINYLDESLAILFNEIKKKFRKNCMIIITADHGESFYEHGYFHHQGNIYDELLKVPLFIIDLAKDSQYNNVTNLIQLRDLPITILDYFKIEESQKILGKSLLPLVYGDSDQGEKYIISECFQKEGKIKRNHKEGYILLSIRSYMWKYIFDEEKNLEYLFNLSIDPLEKNNLINNNQKELTDFRELRDIHLLNVKDSEEKLKILRSVSNLNLRKNETILDKERK
ncbi:MAG: sulfatase-like hydrolase/transferase [Promethearchaeota archaeon]